MINLYFFDRDDTLKFSEYQVSTVSQLSKKKNNEIKINLRYILHMKIEEFKELASPPECIEATSILIRMIDGISFRFYNATESLREDDHNYRPAHDCMSVNELLHHIEKLAYWVHNSFVEEQAPLNFKQRSFHEMRLSILNKFNDIKKQLSLLVSSNLNDIKIRDYPFWNMINGPLADTLTHIGQINTYRRLNGNPAGKRSPFTGK